MSGHSLLDSTQQWIDSVPQDELDRVDEKCHLLQTAYAQCIQRLDHLSDRERKAFICYLCDQMRKTIFHIEGITEIMSHTRGVEAAETDEEQERLMREGPVAVDRLFDEAARMYRDRQTAQQRLNHR